MGRIFTKLKSECPVGHEGFNFVKIPICEVSLTILKHSCITELMENKLELILFGLILSLITTPNEVWGKVIFSQASVILLTGGSASVHAGIPPPGRPPPGRPPSRKTPLQAHNQGGEIEGDQTQTPPMMTTAVGGMHPTGMHSCLELIVPEHF